MFLFCCCGFRESQAYTGFISSYMERSSHYQIVLLGPCGCGKSAFGNTLIMGTVFESRKSLTSSSVTKDLQSETIEYQGENFQIIDTPCFSEIAKSQTFLDNFRKRYDVIAIVVPLERLTSSIEKIFDSILEKCNLRPDDPIIVVYTKAEESTNIINDFLLNSNSDVLNDIHKLSNDRYISIDNTSIEDRIKKRSEFLAMAAALIIEKKKRRRRYIRSVAQRILSIFLACTFFLACIFITFGIIYYRS